MPKPRVLLTNDDGPPSSDSPYIYGLYRYLTAELGWDVKVVVPSSQKSWIGKAYHITEVTKGRYYYPREPDGLGETSAVSRPLKDGEVAEWILLDGTPATCANVGLHNIYHDEIDLLLSGPNLGRNTSAAFALSSGTIGAALSGSLSQKRSIAVSYGTVLRPTPVEFLQPAHVLSSKIIRHLWENWGEDETGLRNGEVDLYNVNIPLVEGLVSEDGLKICWTTIWRNSYGRLFKAVSASDAVKALPKLPVNPAGPDAQTSDPRNPDSGSAEAEQSGNLLFKWSPDVGGLINPLLADLPIGSDGWAIHHGWASVTPLRATFGEPATNALSTETGNIEGKMWKLKL